MRRTGKADIRLSLAAYSYNRHLNLRGKAKPTMTLEEFIDTAAKMSLPAVELTAYYFRETTFDHTFLSGSNSVSSPVSANTSAAPA